MDENYKALAELNCEKMAIMAIQSFELECSKLPAPIPNQYECEFNGYSELFTVTDPEGKIIHSTPLIIPYDPRQPKAMQQDLIGILKREPLSQVIIWNMKLQGKEHVWRLEQITKKVELLEVIA